MEDNELSPKPIMLKSKTEKWPLIILFIIIVIGTTVPDFLIICKQRNMLESKNDLLMKQEADQSSCIYKRDSMATELNRLAIYKSLTKSMVYRDEAIMGLRHKVGDIAYAKRDSAQVVISDIVIGGSKYEYYIKYRILRKDNTSEEIIPELLY